MKVTLLSFTPEPLEVIYTAARTCYSSKSPEEIKERIPSKEDQIALIKKVTKSGHLSVMEHVSFTFSISGVSRTLTHQLVRHRLASYSQQSQRYVKQKTDVVIPPTVKGKYKEQYEKMISDIFEFYQEMVKNGIPKEDARYILPNATYTTIVMTMNFRELYHTAALRLCFRAQWEIRKMFEEIAARVREVDPFLGGMLVPTCKILGYCPEEKTCGYMPTLNELLEKEREKGREDAEEN